MVNVVIKRIGSGSRLVIRVVIRVIVSSRLNYWRVGCLSGVVFGLEDGVCLIEMMLRCFCFFFLRI